MRKPLVLLLPAAFVALTAASPGNHFKTHLSGDQEVPAVSTRATGEAQFRLRDDGLHYTLIVANIDNVAQAHIHLAPAGQNGPVVAFLFGPVPPGGGPSNGRIADGVITAADLVGPLAGASMSDLVDHLRAGNIYVNVHTSDGVDPPNSGPGDFASGELRGQVSAPGN